VVEVVVFLDLLVLEEVLPFYLVEVYLLEDLEDLEDLGDLEDLFV
jgi:hypothetical protein